MRRWQEIDLHQVRPPRAVHFSTRRQGFARSASSRLAAGYPLLHRAGAGGPALQAAELRDPDAAQRARAGPLEYLLFYEGTDNDCAAAAPINASGTWAALAADPAELGRRKREYAAVVAADVARRAHELVDAWDPDKGNFLGQVTRAGSAGAVYASSQAALNSQADALFYLDNAPRT